MLLGKERATAGKFNTSPIMSIITRPRYASTAMLRGGADAAVRMVARGRSAPMLSVAIVECIPIALIHWSRRIYKEADSHFAAEPGSNCKVAQCAEPVPFSLSGSTVECHCRKFHGVSFGPPRCVQKNPNGDNSCLTYRSYEPRLNTNRTTVDPMSVCCNADSQPRGCISLNNIYENRGRDERGNAGFD